MDNIITFIFDRLFSERKIYLSHEIKSSTVEIKISDTLMNFYLSILINERYLVNDECDEIVLEISSKDGKNFNLDISDSLGIVYFESLAVSNLVDIKGFFDASYSIIKNVLNNLTID